MDNKETTPAAAHKPAATHKAEAAKPTSTKAETAKTETATKTATVDAKADSTTETTTPATSKREGEVAKIGQEITEQANATQQPVHPADTGAPVPENVALPNFGEQGAQQHTLNAQSGVTASTDVPAAAATTAEPAPAVQGGATNAAAAGPLSRTTQALPTQGTQESGSGTAADVSAPETAAPANEASTEATFTAPVGIDAKVIADGSKGPQVGYVKGVTFGEDKKPVSYSVEIEGKPFNPTDPNHHHSVGRPKEDFPAAMVRKA